VGAAATAGGPLWGTSYARGTVLLLNPAGALYAAIGSANLRPYAEGTDDIGHAGLHN
jgi:hypothetical protein